MNRVDIAIASPSDVPEERAAVLQVFTSWNSANRYAILHANMSESASVPTMGDHPQHILNKQIIDESDLLVAILWSRLGTPTPTARSGTVEEIREFIATKGPGRAMIYFCNRPIAPKDMNPAELMKLQKFRAEIGKQGLYREYMTVDEFQSNLYHHVGMKVKDLLSGALPLPSAGSVNVIPDNAPSAQHPDERLRSPIDFGRTLGEIAGGFVARMNEFSKIDGCARDKYLDLGAHVYCSAAHSIDQYVTFNRAGVDETNRRILQEISNDLKGLAARKSEYRGKRPFPIFWTLGEKIACNFSAHVNYLEQMHSR